MAGSGFFPLCQAGPNCSSSFVGEFRRDIYECFSAKVYR